jgi:hypothetical protein
MKHLSEEDLILIYYNEPAAPAEMRTHASECAECRAAAEPLAHTLGLCTEWNIPEPDAPFERSVWARLAPVIAAEPSGRINTRINPRRWFVPSLWIAAAAVVRWPGCLRHVAAQNLRQLLARSYPGAQEEAGHAIRSGGPGGRGALDELIGMERAAFVLRHYEGLGIEEISATLGVQPGAARHSIFRAVQKLRRALGAVAAVRQRAPAQ